MKTTSKIVNEYLHKSDWRVKENSTVSYNIGGLILSNSGNIVSDYWLSEIYDKEIADAHRNADIHIHDLAFLGGYCAGWSLKQLIQEGLGGVTGRITSSPASHLSTLCNQMVNFLGIMQNEWAGAQAFSSFDTYLAPFVKIDNLTYKEVKQCVQSFIFGVNTPSRWGTQAPFTNITLDWTVPNDLANLNCIVGGKEVDFCYRDCEKEMAMINKAFIEIMIEGDANGRGFQYPIPTYSITRDFDWSETENNKLLFEMTAKYGTPYFSNYVNSDMEPSDVRSMCPLTPDTKVVVRSPQNGVRVESIGKIYRTYINTDVDYEVLTPSGWCKGHPVQTPKTKVVEITLSNGQSIRMGINHLQPVRGNGTLHADEIKIGMQLPFSKSKYGSDLGSKELGFAVGAYLGDGSRDNKAIVYSLASSEKDNETEMRVCSFWKSLGFTTRTTVKDGVRFVRVNGNPYSIISYFVDGDNALNKHIRNSAFNSSAEFKEGLIEGMRATDGSREKKRLYTASKTLRDDLCYILSSIGHKYMRTKEDNRDGRYGKNSVYRVDFPERDSYSYGGIKLYEEDDDYIYYTVVEIKEVNATSEYLYCFEIDNDDHLFTLANGLVTHNCRLRLDLRELRKKSGGFFGSGESTGSVGVVTINLPRVAYLSDTKEEFYGRLDNLLDLSARSLDIKRKNITKWLEDGLYPYTKRYLGTFNNHFSTLGIVGGNEACLNAKWLGKDMSHKESQDFMKEVLNHIREKLSDYQEKYGDLFNLEATPAESTSYRFAKHDKERYPDIITATSDECGSPYYTNSTNLPVGYTSDIFSALDVQDELQTLYTSGTVFHAFLGQRLDDWKVAMSLVRKIAENYKLPYYTMSPTYSVCTEHGYIMGEQYKCPICGKTTEVYSRITGYYRPIQNWNDGKLQEFKERQTYQIANIDVNKNMVAEVDENKKHSVFDDDILLFTTKTCPNCKMSKLMLNKANIAYKNIDAEDEKEMTIDFKVRKAPTMFVWNGYEYDRYENASEIKKYIEDHQ